MKRCLVVAALIIGIRDVATAQEPPPPPPRPITIPPKFMPDLNLPEPPVLRRPSPLPPLPMTNDSPLGSTPASPSPERKIAPSDTVPLLPQAQQPLVTVELIAPDMANVGQPLTQELIVRNLGKSAVTQVRVEQELPSHVRYLGGDPRADFPAEKLAWSVGILEAGAEKHIKVIVQSSTEGDLCCRATVTFATTCGSVTKLTRPKLAVSITGPESALVGETATFQINLANTGTGPIHKLVLRDKLPAGLQHPAGPTLEAEVPGLASGEARTVTLKTTAIKPGQFVHEIQAIADGQLAAIQTVGTARNPDLEATARTPVRIVEPGLHLRLTGPKTCLIKCDCILSIDLTNPGSAPTKNIVLSTRIPDGMDFVALSEDGRHDPATRTAAWSFSQLEPGAHRVLTLKVRGTALGETSGIVVAQADGGLTAKAELPIHVEGVPALAVELIDIGDPAPVGDDLTYEVRVLNQGTCPCTGIQIVATMPEGMELREVSAPAPYKLLGQQVQFAAFPKLATKADIVYRIKVRSRVPGDVRFRAQLTCDQLQQPVLKEESSRFYKP